MRKAFFILIPVVVCSLPALAADVALDHGVFKPNEIQWKEGPAALPPGAKMALLEGDPSKEGPFTIRLWFPAGYIVPPHWHLAVEHFIVLSGTSLFGMGDKFDESKLTPLPAGTFAYYAPKMTHFAMMKEDTILQTYAMGPWKVIYVNPQDDPRLKSTGAKEMNQPVTVVVRLKAKPGMEERVKQELTKLLAPTRAEKGCLNYDMHQSLDDKSLFLFYENWKSEEDLKAHFETAPIKNWLKLADELLAEPLDIKKWRRAE